MSKNKNTKTKTPAEIIIPSVIRQSIWMLRHKPTGKFLAQPCSLREYDDGDLHGFHRYIFEDALRICLERKAFPIAPRTKWNEYEIVEEQVTTTTVVHRKIAANGTSKSSKKETKR